MIYLDSSVLLARLLAEARCPPDPFWRQPLLSSRLLQFEVVSRMHAHRSAALLVADARHMIARIEIFEMTSAVLMRALDPFPVPVRTLDALHLATMEYLRRRGQTLSLASYDLRLCTAAQALGFPLADK